MGTCFDCYYGKKDICPSKNPYKKDECSNKRTEDDMKIERRRDNAICEAYKANRATEDICKEFNISKGSLYTILGRNDVPLRRTTQEEDILSSEVLKALDDGLTQTEVAEKFRTTRYHVQKIVRAAKHKAKLPTPVVKTNTPKVSGTEFSLYSYKLEKPHPSFHPAERNNRLVWKLDVTSLEELIDVSKSIKENIVIEDGAIYLKTLPKTTTLSEVVS